MSQARDLLAQQLDKLEDELRWLGLWAEQAPEEAALSSSLPFCADTLEFEQWLQWVLLPRMRSLLADHASLPPDCGLRPMGEQSLLHLGRRRVNLLQVLEQIDYLVQSAQ